MSAQSSPASSSNQESNNNSISIPNHENNNSSVYKSAVDSLYISSTTESTFQYDDDLPSLPLPSLKNTLSKYLDTVRPHVNEEEFAHTESLVQEFEHGQGKLLHEKLLQKSSQSKNWLEKWWLDCAYLQCRLPLIPYQNMSGVFPTPDYWPPQPGTRIERCALMMYLNLKFFTMIRNQTLRPMVHKGVPWSMDQFRRVYNTVRIPGDPQDELRCPFKTASEGPIHSSAVIVLYRGFIFTFDMILPDESILTPQELAYQLLFIETWCQSQERDGPGIGALTVTDRSLWAKNRQYLRNLHPENEKNMDIIENAIGVYAFEDSEPLSQTDVLMEVMGGDCCNRWADKSSTAIFFRNGLSGASCDHTPMDGFCTAVMTHYVTTSLNECKGVFDGENKFREQITRPERLEFHVDDVVFNEIEKAKSVFRENTSDVSVTIKFFDGFGKAALKSHKFHPEAFVQIALQLAYYRMYGKPASTYVTATTRRYFHGRTETCRACFPENVDFAKAVIDGSASPGQLYQLLKKAVSKFQSMMQDATNNEGCDRHFLGLYMIAQEEGLELPSIFGDPAFIRSGGGGNYVLSTSCTGYWSVAGGVPPMVENGYGCFYGIEDHRMTFTITCLKHVPDTNVDAFFNNIKLSLQNMNNILSTESKL